jgi:hypothetical protein
MFFDFNKEILCIHILKCMFFQIVWYRFLNALSPISSCKTKVPMRLLIESQWTGLHSKLEWYPFEKQILIEADSYNFE